MRKIKFRMWVPEEDGEPGHMISGDDLAFEEYLPVTQLLSQEVVMQYTGLKDKNGVEIYEGDIVKYHMWSKNLIVKYNIYSCAFCAVVDNCAYPIRTVDELEVIGNIYDNPELLEARDDV